MFFLCQMLDLLDEMMEIASHLPVPIEEASYSVRILLTGLFMAALKV